MRRTSHESINLKRNSYLDCSSDTHCTRGEFRRVTYWLQTLRIWRRWTHRKSTRKRLNAKEVIFPKQGEFIFPIADGRIKDQDLRTSTLVRHRPIQGESHINFLGESEGSLPPPHDSFPDAGEAINDFWSMSGNFIYRHHVEPRVKLYSPREESFPIPLKYIWRIQNYSYELGCQTKKKRIDDYWHIDGSRDLSDPWTGFTQFTLLEEKPPEGYMWSSGRLTTKQKEKQKGSHEKTQLDNARKLRGIFSLTLRTRKSSKMQEEDGKPQVAPAMHCKTCRKNKHGETCSKSNDFNS